VLLTNFTSNLEKMKKYITIALSIIFSNSFAQQLDWVKTIGYAPSSILWNGDLNIEGLTNDNIGNTYSVTYGNNSNNFAFNNGPLVNAPNSNISGVIIKSNSSGVQNWVKFLTPEWISGNSGAWCKPSKIAYRNGNIYVAGSLSGFIDMDPGSATSSFYGSSSCFIAKYDTLGTLIWVQGFGGPGSQVMDVNVDNSDNVYLSGNSLSSFSFNGNNYTNSGGTDIFLLKYTPSGVASWSVYIPTNSSYSTLQNSIATDANNNVFWCGAFQGVQDFNPGPSSSLLTSNGLLDGFVVKYNSTGAYLNGINIGGVNQDRFTSIHSLGSDICVTGDVGSSTLDMNGGTAVNNLNISTIGGVGGFVLKMNNDLVYQWALPINSTGSTKGIVTKLQGNNIYLMGEFTGTADLNPDLVNEFLVSAPSLNIVSSYIIKLNSSGSFIWGGAFVNQGDLWTMQNYGYNNAPKGLSISNDGVYLCGGFKGQVDFDMDTQNTQIAASGLTPAGIAITSGFLVKIGNCAPVSSSQQVSTCNQYSWNGQTYQSSGTYLQNFQSTSGCDSTVTLNLTINYPSSSSFSATSCEPYTWNGNTYAGSGQYSQTLTGSNGCDSVVTLDLTILNGPSAQVTQDGLLLTANNVPGATYQWIYCSDLTPVPNQSFIQFAPQANGTYAVVITDNCGSDTSDCITISTIGIDELNNYFSVYPNPTSSELNVSIDILRVNTYFEIYDLNNRLIKSGNVLDVEKKIDVNSLSNGVYILKLDNTSAIRFVKQ
jgi:hypothetical protein